VRERKKKQKNLKRRELRGRSSLFEKFGGGVEQIGPVTHVLFACHFYSFSLFFLVFLFPEI